MISRGICSATESCVYILICAKMNAVSVCSVALLYLLTTSGSTDAISCKLSEVPVEDRMCVCVISGGPHDGQVIDLMPLSGQVL